MGTDVDSIASPRMRGVCGLGLIGALIALLLSPIACSERDPSDETTPPARSDASAPARSGPPNLLLITFDTTRADALGSYGQARPTSPVLDQLGERGVVFEHVLTSNPETLPSHATIFTGRWPFAHGVRANSGYVLSRSNVTLAETLRSRGYRTGAEVASRVLRSETLITQGFDHYRGADSPDVELKEIFFTDEEAETQTLHMRVGADISRRGIEFVRTHQKRPFFLWLHYFDAHAPYSAPPRFNRAIPDSPYHAEVAYQDFEAGKVLDELERLGLSSNTLVVMTADHGEDLGDHGEVTHSYGVYDTTMRVPLILAGLETLPQGLRLAWPVRTLDIAPTILDLLGQPQAPGSQGVSLKPLLSNRGSDPGLAGYGESTRFMTTFGLPVLRFIRKGRWKYIHKVNPELYDVLADPAERNNLIAEQPDLADSLRQELESMVQSTVASPTDATHEVDRETAAELSVLGYLAHDAASQLQESGEDLTLWGVDPVVAIDDAGAVAEARGLMVRHDYAGAWQRIEPIWQRYPDSKYLLDLVATTQYGLGDARAAAQAMRRILELAPCDAKARRALLSLLRKEQRAAELVDVLDTRARACPEDFENLNDYAWALATLPNDSLRDGARAVELARRALDGSEPPPLAMLDTLACALAESGDYEEALKVGDDMLARARASGAPQPVMAELERHVQSFSAGQPIREAL